ncbi:MAG: YebC/PmpR family DNA-binding transcriptional regulator [candidate division KSB1 bacterium]|nr:YebC/PmpR family DNA-binding transcriptional regulator [candidate division KSB1 bacterium]
MSGHSKWSTIKRKKAAKDAQKGRVFTRLIREITVAAKEGGGDEESNPRLRTAVQDAKAANMPVSNIEKAIKKGTGELPGVSYEEVVYEGYAPGGVALYMQTLTDNKNRTVAEIRHILSKHGGSLGESGSVGWMFTKLGVINVPADSISEDDLMMMALDAGAEDIENDPDYFIVKTDPGDLSDVKSALDENGLKYIDSKIIMEPQNTVAVEGKEAEQVLKLMDALEDQDDMQNIYANFDIDDSVIEEYNS